MRPLLHPTLVNGRTGDPALYVETMFETRAVLFDLGDIAALPPRKVQRLDLVFVSHTHIDHFIGFDHLLRLLVGRAKRLQLFGPAGFIAQVGHKLAAYRWNLVDSFKTDLVFEVAEFDAALAARRARFRLKAGFAEEPAAQESMRDGVIHAEETFTVTATSLEHRTQCLAFAIREAAHVNVWKPKIAEMGLEVGPWLRELKHAVVTGRGDEFPVAVGEARRKTPLGRLRHLVTVTPGQKIAYVTDAADTADNRAAIIALARDADLLFIEAPFAAADAELAGERAHLTTTAAGEIARQAGVRRVEPFHFSPRYEGEEARLADEVQAAFAGGS